MGYAVGVDFGSVLSKAGIIKWDNDFPLCSESLRVTGTTPSVAYVNSDNTLLVGDCAHQRGAADPQRVIRDFKRRLGDPVPIMVGDWAGKTETVVAAVISHIIAGVATEEGGPPDAIAVTHPASWGAYKQELLVAALTEAGLTEVTLVSEPQAAGTSTARGGLCAGPTIVVYDLGGGSFEATVLVRVGDGEFNTLGHPQGLDWLGGSDFDQAVFSRVQRAAGLRTFDAADRAAVADLGRLRRDCTAAKESLSIDTEATVTVQAAGRRSRIRLVRSEFEELIRDAIDDTVDATRRAISSAGLAEQDIDAIVLVGGSSRIPLVAQVVSAEFSLPIVIDGAPEASTALGAAWLALAALRTGSGVSTGLDVDDFAGPTAQTPPTPPTDTPDEAPPLDRAPGTPAAAKPGVPLPPLSAPPQTPPTVPGSPPVSPPPSGGSGSGPAGRPDQPERRGRHRRRGSRRYWIRVAGIVTVIAVVISAGSVLATSQASDGVTPGGGPRANSTSSPPAAPTSLSELQLPGPLAAPVADPMATGVPSAAR